MVTSHDFQLLALPIMGRVKVSVSGDFRELSMCVLVCLLTCVFMCGMRLRMRDNFPSAVGIIVSESVWNRGHNSTDGADYM